MAGSTGPKPLESLILEATPPLVSALARDVHRFCCGRDCPTVFNPFAESTATFFGERSITVHFEPPVRQWVCEQLHTASGAHLMSEFASTTSVDGTSRADGLNPSHPGIASAGLLLLTNRHGVCAESVSSRIHFKAIWCAFVSSPATWLPSLPTR